MNGTKERSPGRVARRVDNAGIAATVRGKFLKSPYAELRRIACEYHDGILTLRGCVASFFLKQMAQTLAMQVDDVGMVVNHLVVADGAAAVSKNSP